MGKTLQSQKSQQNISGESTLLSKHENGINQITQLHPLLRLQQTIGNQAVLRLLKSGTLQTKLKINQPGDTYEQEAERVADQVMRMPDKEASGISKGNKQVQRKCAGCTSGQGTCSKCAEEEEEEIVQAKEMPGGAPETSSEVEAHINSIGRGGQPLPKSVRSYFEPRFGYDFSGVRVHTDSHATESAKGINALAYTVGKDVVFGAGQYEPEKMEGKNLLAHELTHVVQQGAGRHFPQFLLHGSTAEQKPGAHFVASGNLILRKCMADSEVCTGGAEKKPSPESKPTSTPTEEATGIIAGSPGAYSAEVGKEEKKTREEATKKPPEEKKKEKALHGRRAVYLERLGKEARLDMHLVHGVFVDLYMASGGKLATCSSYLPSKLGIPYEGDAGKKCIIASDTLEKQAEYYFKNPDASRIPIFEKGSSATWPRGEWRSRVALRVLEHELQHHRYDTATTHPDDPAGACTLNTVVFKDPATGYEYKVSWYLSEMSAILSEFPLVYRYAPPNNRGLGLAPWALRNAMEAYVESEGESICGALTSLRCHCDCGEVDTYVRNTLNFTSTKWTDMERIYLNDVLSRWRKGACKGAKPKQKKTDLDWPIKPSSKQLAELQQHLDVREFGVPPRLESRPFTFGLGGGGLGKRAGLLATAGTEWGFSNDQVAKIAWMGGPRLTVITGVDSLALLAGVRFGFEYRNDIRRSGFIVGGFGEAGAAFEKPLSGTETSGIWDMYLQVGGYAGYRLSGKPGLSISAEGFGGSTLGIDDASRRTLWGVGVRIGIELPSFRGSK